MPWLRTTRTDWPSSSCAPSRARRCGCCRQAFLSLQCQITAFRTGTSALGPGSGAVGGGVAASMLVNLVYVMVVLPRVRAFCICCWGRDGTARLQRTLDCALLTLLHLPSFGQDRFVPPLLPVLTMYAAWASRPCRSAHHPGAMTADASPASVSDQTQPVPMG
ncbi:MAG: hypothetical protein R3A10_02710 [Caldilineaceae bacterium]